MILHWLFGHLRNMPQNYSYNCRDYSYFSRNYSYNSLHKRFLLCKKVAGLSRKTNNFMFLIKICGELWGIVGENYYFCNGQILKGKILVFACDF